MQRIELPASLEFQLHQFRRQVWTAKMVQAGAIALCAVLACYLCSFGLDRLFDAPAPLRGTLGVAALIGCGVVPWFIVRWVWRRRRHDQVAQLVVRRMPALGDQLLGVIELAADESEQLRSPTLCNAAIHQGARDAEQHDLRTALPPTRLGQWGSAAFAGVACAMALAIAAPSASKNAWRRFLTPWEAIPRFTFAMVEPLPAALVIAHGEPFFLCGKLSDSTLWRPSKAQFQLDAQSAIDVALAADTYLWQGPPLLHPVDLRVTVGDWSQQVRIEPKLRPELTALNGQIELPTYLGQGEELQQDGRGGVVSAVRGSRVALRADVNRPLASVVVEGGRGRVDGSMVAVDPYDVVEPHTLQLRWKDQYGLENKEPFVVSIAVEEDEAPTVTGEGLPRRQVVLDSEQLTFRLTGRDDYGVREVGMEWRGIAADLSPEPTGGERLIALGDSHRRVLEAEGTFTASSLGISSQPIELRLYTVDYFPDRQRTYSPPSILFVLNAEDHAVWITDQMSRWHRQSLEVRDRELQLYETNKQLRDLPSTDLDLPDNRRRIEKQAAAERANGRRLAMLSKEGGELLKLAARNPEIGVGHLDRWASMLAILQEISTQRMPSVADLLQQGAEAQAANEPAPQQSTLAAGQVRAAGRGKPSKSAPMPSRTPLAPQVVDLESSQQPAGDDLQGAPEKKQPSSPTLRLPATTLVGQEKSQSKTPSPASEQVAEAVDEQRDLLAEFDKVANELNSVLANLEGSTLVKRLKAASRNQSKIAGAIGEGIDNGFGRSKASLDRGLRSELGELSNREVQSGDHVSNIMDDIQAYFERRQMVQFKLVLDDMRQVDVLGNLRRLADEIPIERGLAIAQCEYWSDAMDRWAEDLVDPVNGGQCPGCPSRGSLPPSIVLEAIKILEGEMNLREETRVAEQARSGWEVEAYFAEAERLSGAQADLGVRVENVVARIAELPEADALFAKEIALLRRVDGVMDEAAGLLAQPETGSAAIAAETEAIELLLESKRINPSGGGGGGSSPGGGGGGDTDDLALALIGPGLNPHEVREDRGPHQSTGESGEELPEEFRAGLDRYFNALEEL